MRTFNEYMEAEGKYPMKKVRVAEGDVEALKAAAKLAGVRINKRPPVRMLDEYELTVTPDEYEKMKPALKDIDHSVGDTRIG